MRRKTLIRRSKVDWANHMGRYPLLYNCNIYLGCIHSCKYCYARKMFVRWHKRDWGDVEYAENAVELAKKEVKKLKPGRIMFPSMTDCYQLMEKKLGLAREVLKILLDSEFHVLIMTKSDLVTRDYDIMQGHDNVEVGLTITSLEDLPEWEPGAPGNTRRIDALIKAHELGLKTFVGMEPVIPGVTKPMEIMEALKPYVDRWIIGALNYMGVNHEDAYHDQVPKWQRYAEENNLKVMWKKELKKFLS